MLKFLGYRVEGSSFKNNEMKKGPVITLTPNIQMDIKKDPKTLTLTITVVVEGTEEKPTPFDLMTRIKGSFEIVEDSLDINKMRIESSRVLFPYVRSYITTYTALCGIPPYILPVIDFEAAPIGRAPAPQAQGSNNGQAPSSSSSAIKIIPPDNI